MIFSRGEALSLGAASALAMLITTWIGYQRRLASNLEYNLEYNSVQNTLP